MIELLYFTILFFITVLFLWLNYTNVISLNIKKAEMFIDNFLLYIVANV